MDSYEARLLAAQISSHLPALDLHGVYPTEAPHRVELFLYDAHKAQQGAVKIVYGIGTGALGAAVLRYLREHPLVATMQEQTAHCIVLLN